MTSGGTTVAEHNHDDHAREDDGADHLAIVREAAQSVGITDPDHVQGFIEMYNQMANMDGDLTPGQLSAYTAGMKVLFRVALV